eukprot:jgi/Botrbrau1/15222/Bobra.0149s0077.1
MLKQPELSTDAVQHCSCKCPDGLLSWILNQEPSEEILRAALDKRAPFMDMSKLCEGLLNKGGSALASYAVEKGYRLKLSPGSSFKANALDQNFIRTLEAHGLLTEGFRTVLSTKTMDLQMLERSMSNCRLPECETSLCLALAAGWVDGAKVLLEQLQNLFSKHRSDFQRIQHDPFLLEFAMQDASGASVELLLDCDPGLSQAAFSLAFAHGHFVVLQRAVQRGCLLERRAIPVDLMWRWRCDRFKPDVFPPGPGNRVSPKEWAASLREFMTQDYVWSKRPPVTLQSLSARCTAYVAALVNKDVARQLALEVSGWWKGDFNGPEQSRAQWVAREIREWMKREEEGESGPHKPEGTQTSSPQRAVT